MEGHGRGDEEQGRQVQQSGTERSLSLTQRTHNKIKRGLEGKNERLPIALRRLSDEVGIGGGFYTLIGGESSTGKSAYAHENYVIFPYNWWIKNRHKTNKKIRIFMWAMERPAENTLGKWMCFYVWNKYHELIDVNKIFGFNRSRLTEDEITMIEDCLGYFEQMEDIVTVYEDPINPTGIYKRYCAWARENGTIKKNRKGEKIYVPNDPELITLIVLDHVGIVKSEKDKDTKMKLNNKEKLDKLSEYLRHARDFYGFSPVAVCQFNRSIQETHRRNSIVKPEARDFEGSSSMYQDCDVATAIHNPSKYESDKYFGYKVGELVDDYGVNRFRTVHVLKNTYGRDDLVVGTNFIGEVGYFRDLPPSAQMTDQIYHEARNAIQGVSWPIEPRKKERKKKFSATLEKNIEEKVAKKKKKRRVFKLTNN